MTIALDVGQAQTRSKIFAIGLISVALTACGGGGSSGDSTSTTSTASTSPTAPTTTSTIPTLPTTPIIPSTSTTPSPPTTSTSPITPTIPTTPTIPIIPTIPTTPTPVTPPILPSTPTITKSIAVSIGGLSACEIISSNTSSNVTNCSNIGFDSISDAIGISVGVDSFCAVLSTGAIKCAGYNATGQLGNGVISNKLSLMPVIVSGISNAIAVSVGNQSACAVLFTGSVQCWGSNNTGQLGSGTFNNSLTPVTVLGVSNAKSVSVGNQSACAVLSTGSVKCWGRNNIGQLGFDPTAVGNTDTPLQLTNVVNVSEISVGDQSTCVLLTTKNVQCWGSNFFNQLGDRSVKLYSSNPVAVLGISGAISISNGSNSACAVISDGTVKCWGSNNSGQFGTAVIGVSDLPKPAIGLTNAITVSVGNGSACSLLSTGATKCWGQNSSTTYTSNGSIVNSLRPISISGLQ